MLFKKRVQTHILEKIVAFFMVLFGSASLYIFVQALNQARLTGEPVSPLIAVIEVMMIILIAIFANIWISIKIYEQHKP